MQERFYFGDEVLPLFETGIPLLKQRLSQLPDADNVSILHSLMSFTIALPFVFLTESLL